MSQQILQQKLGALRRRQTIVAAGSGLAVVVTGGLLLLAAQMAVDWWLELPWVARLILLALDAAILGALLATGVVRPIRRPLGEDEAALLVEQAVPSLRTRLISAVQLPVSPEGQRAPAIVARLVNETETATAQLDFARVISLRRLVRHLLVVFVATGWGIFSFQSTRPVSDELLRRVFLSATPVPRKTQVECLTGDCVVARGENIVIEARAHGLVPATGELTVHSANGRQTFSMTASGNDRRRFRRELDNVQETFTYRVRLNDGTSDSFRITVEPPPTIAVLNCVQIYPAYTGLAPQPCALSDLVLLAGSTLQIEGRSTKPLQQATLHLAGLNRTESLVVDQGDRQRLAGKLPITGNELRGFAVALRDESGLSSREEVVYRIEVVPDKAPRIALLHPTRREELITRDGMLLLSLAASDDFGIAGLTLHYKLGDNAPEQVVEFDLEGRTDKSLRRRHEWQPAVAEGSVIEYWLEARDNNQVTGPGTAVTDRYLVKVVSAAEKRADLLGRLDDALIDLNQVTASQEKLNQSLGDLIRGKPRARVTG